MKKQVIFMSVLMLALTMLSAQTRSTLAVLPFSGGSEGEGSALALLFEDFLGGEFRVVSRNEKIIGAIFKEQNIQRSGLTDSDTIAKLGKQLNAQFVLAGHIQKLGEKNLVLTTVINVETMQQIAGDFREYGQLEEILDYLPDMGNRIQKAARVDSSNKPRLAVLPFDIPQGVGQTDAEALAQLLATEVANSGKYMVLPRTTTIETVMKEHNIQRSGITDANSIREVGKALNAEYVLAGSVLKVGAINLFSAKIVHITSSEQLEGGSVRYAVLGDGLKLMPQLSEKLTGVKAGSVGGVAVPDNMVLVEGGTFSMGSSNGESDEAPVHQVTVDSFYMSKYEVTQKEWVAVIGNNPSNFKGDTLPVESVSWYEVIEYCNRLSVKEGLDVVYSGSGNTVLMNRNANGYRLPTEAEWEYAAKGGNKESLTSEYSGSNSIDRVAWYTGNSGSKTQPVGSKYPNALGIYDLSGNVWEWCGDWYGAYSTGSQTNPTGSHSDSSRVIRGGGWYSNASSCRVSGRGNYSPGSRDYDVGFRPVRSLR